MTVRSIWGNLRSEERFLLVFSFVALLYFILFLPESVDLYGFFVLEVKAFTVSFMFFQGAFIVAAAYFVYFYFKKLLAAAGYFSGPKAGKLSIRLLAKRAIGLVRPFFFLMLGFSSLVIALCALTAGAQGRLENEMLMAWDKAVFGNYPFVWLHAAQNPLKPVFDDIALLIIWSFHGLSLLIGATIIYFVKNRKIYPALVISFFMAMGIGLVFWQIIPANSPNNFILSENPSFPGYQPNKYVLEYQERVRERQKEMPPVSTFPSSHVNWGVQIVYFWAVHNRKTLWLSIPWFLLMVLGTVYLAQHYAVDILLGIPLGAVSIAAGRFLAKRLERPAPQFFG